MEQEGSAVQDNCKYFKTLFKRFMMKTSCPSLIYQVPTYNIKVDLVTDVWHSVHLAFVPPRVLQSSVLGCKFALKNIRLCYCTVMMSDHCWVGGEMFTPILLSWLNTNWPTDKSPGLDMFFSLTQEI